VLNVQKSLPKILIDFTSAIIQIFFGLVLLSFYHIYFIAFGLVLIFVIFLVFYFTSKNGLETSINESKYKYKVVYWLEELGRSVQSFKLAGNPGLPIAKTDRLLEKYISYRKKHFSILVKQFSAIVIFKTAITAGLLILGGALVFTEQINLGQFVASEIIILLVINSVEKLIGSVAVVYDMLTALDKIAQVTDLEMERNAGRDVADLNIQEQFHLELCDLSYKYPGAKEYSFKKINFEINKGEKVCIAGFNDSGKTTLVKTIAGLFEQYEGVIKLNGISIKELNMTSYRDMIGDNLNITDVFEGTIEENITLGRKGILLKDILEACKTAGLDTFISGLQDGLQAMVSPAGSNFPSNVVKKILLARSFVQHPKLILIDEFFHNVQSAEKRKLFDVLFSGNYAILIASTIPEVMQRCDKIVVLKNGSIADMGTYNELLSRSTLPNS
jgi:ABC-type bacteriocin/lantibiotic exporter with double-glycine peptidase domain